MLHRQYANTSPQRWTRQRLPWETPTPEVNRLNDVRNDAIDAMIDACGLPR
jgi:hypothetical protein